MSRTMKIGIIGAGWIADRMGETLQAHPEMRYAIASRDPVRARAFAERHGFRKAYGTYRELVEDPEVELVYIATPHSHHYQHCRMALENGKPVLCEKAFTANAREARELVEMAESRGIFITEAIWTRYMPLSLKVKELLDGGAIGKARMLTASIGYPMETKDRIVRPELCGGVLLDLTVYPINFARMYFGSDFESCSSACVKLGSGMDIIDSVTLRYKDGKMAVLHATGCSASDLQGVICGEEGYIVVDNINNPAYVRVYDTEHRMKEEYTDPGKITGYEYQVYASEEALRNGWLESPYMPHAETIAVMEQMDALRREWGIRYPMD